jgi:hypothetical protein
VWWQRREQPINADELRAETLRAFNDHAPGHALREDCPRIERRGRERRGTGHQVDPAGAKVAGEMMLRRREALQARVVVRLGTQRESRAVRAAGLKRPCGPDVTRSSPQHWDPGVVSVNLHPSPATDDLGGLAQLDLRVVLYPLLSVAPGNAKTATSAGEPLGAGKVIAGARCGSGTLMTRFVGPMFML